MTDTEISLRLATAIGWPFAERSIAHAWALVCCDGMTGFRAFDYRDPAVIWPIAERFNLFPGRWNGRWEVWDDELGIETFADTAAKAVALAVIKAHEGQK